MAIPVQFKFNGLFWYCLVRWWLLFESSSSTNPFEFHPLHTALSTAKQMATAIDIKKICQREWMNKNSFSEISLHFFRFSLKSLHVKKNCCEWMHAIFCIIHLLHLLNVKKRVKSVSAEYNLLKFSRIQFGQFLNSGE